LRSLPRVTCPRDHCDPRPANCITADVADDIAVRMMADDLRSEISDRSSVRWWVASRLQAQGKSDDLNGRL